MTRVSIRHGGMLKCGGKDAAGKPCAARFHTYSIFRLVRAQAAVVGWTRRIGWHVTGDREDGLKKVDCCPEHDKIADANLERRAELLEAERNKIRAEKKAAWELVKAARAAKRAAKAAIKEQRAAKRAAKAQKAAQRAATKEQRASERAAKAQAKAQKAAALAADAADAPVKQQKPPKPVAKATKPKGSARATKAAKTKPEAKDQTKNKKTRTRTDREQRHADTKAFVDRALSQPKRQASLPGAGGPEDA